MKSKQLMSDESVLELRLDVAELRELQLGLRGLILRILILRISFHP